MSSSTEVGRAPSVRGTADGLDEYLSRRLATSLTIAPDFAKTLYQGALSGWRGFIEITPDRRVKQLHDIKGLKIYHLPGTWTLVADVALGIVGVGAYKRVKLVAQIVGPNILSSKHVRMTSIVKGFPRPFSQKMQAWADRQELLFTMDARCELEARKVFAGISNIADMTVGQYYNRFGNPKTRYLMIHYPFTLSQAILRENRTLVLGYCAGALRALRKIHDRGWVHCDVKGKNILTNGETGWVSDFGLFRKAGEHVEFTGTPSHMPPEVIFGAPACSSKLDMFSFGMVLFSAVDPNRFERWKAETAPIIHRMRLGKKTSRSQLAAEGRKLEGLLQERRLIRQLPDGAEKESRLSLATGECRKLMERKHEIEQRDALLLQECTTGYLALHGRLLQELGEGASLIMALICSLLSYDPDQRPTAAETEAILTRV